MRIYWVKDPRCKIKIQAQTKARRVPQGELHFSSQCRAPPPTVESKRFEDGQQSCI